MSSGGVWWLLIFLLPIGKEESCCLILAFDVDIGWGCGVCGAKKNCLIMTCSLVDWWLFESDSEDGLWYVKLNFLRMVFEESYYVVLLDFLVPFQCWLCVDPCNHGWGYRNGFVLYGFKCYFFIASIREFQ